MSGFEVAVSRAAQLRDAMAGTYQDAQLLRELIVVAWCEEDAETLGYSDWESYCHRELNTARVGIPKQERHAMVVELIALGATQREAATAANVAKGTVDELVSTDETKERRARNRAETGIVSNDETEPTDEDFAAIEEAGAILADVTKAVKLRGDVMDAMTYEYGLRTNLDEARDALRLLERALYKQQILVDNKDELCATLFPPILELLQLVERIKAA